MKRETLPMLALPRSSLQFAQQALYSARRRRLQMLPGHGPVEPDREEQIAHYLGPEDEAVLGEEPQASDRILQSIERRTAGE